MGNHSSTALLAIQALPDKRTKLDGRALKILLSVRIEELIFIFSDGHRLVSHNKLMLNRSDFSLCCGIC